MRTTTGLKREPLPSEKVGSYFYAGETAIKNEFVEEAYDLSTVACSGVLSSSHVQGQEKFLKHLEFENRYMLYDLELTNAREHDLKDT